LAEEAVERHSRKRRGEGIGEGIGEEI